MKNFAIPCALAASAFAAMLPVGNLLSNITLRDTVSISAMVTTVISGLSTFTTTIDTFTGSDITHIQTTGTEVITIIQTATYDIGNLTVITAQDVNNLEQVVTLYNTAGDDLRAKWESKATVLSESCRCRRTLKLMTQLNTTLSTFTTTVISKISTSQQGTYPIQLKSSFSSFCSSMLGPLSACTTSCRTQTIAAVESCTTAVTAGTATVTPLLISSTLPIISSLIVPLFVTEYPTTLTSPSNLATTITLVPLNIASTSTILITQLDVPTTTASAYPIYSSAPTTFATVQAVSPYEVVTPLAATVTAAAVTSAYRPVSSGYSYFSAPGNMTARMVTSTLQASAATPSVSGQSVVYSAAGDEGRLGRGRGGANVAGMVAMLLGALMI